MADAATIVSTVVGRYPAAMRDVQARDAARIAYHLELVMENTPAGGAVLDLGGGLGLLSPSLAEAGFRTTLVDDFGDEVNQDHPLSALGVHGDVDVQSVDATSPVFAPAAGSLDAVTCIDSLEHWHKGPRPVLHKIMTALKPGGYLLIGVPNCADLKKRVMTPLGRAAWSPMEEWYDKPLFRGHVREPDVADLRHIGDDLGLADVKIFGRNWEYLLRGGAIAALGRGLQAAPSLCSTIYLSGRKPA